MKSKRKKTIISSSFGFETNNKSKVIRKSRHNKKNKALELIKMLFF
ncbi:MAG TPA: hypothetical protein PLD95_00545 [bacterium]|jgi:hypothetical protein|nr:hypothetical protein [bacterium]HOG37943.1 hypothetical protein [bacterium]HQI03001.1 hypothetical protein [bacterium]